MQRSDPNRKPPITVEDKLRCIERGNDQFEYIQNRIKNYNRDMKQIEYIEWEDVISSGSGWYSEDEMKEWCKDVNKAFIIHQCGFVLEETNDYLLLCSHFHPESKLLSKQYGHLQKIVKSLIRKRKKIKV